MGNKYIPINNYFKCKWAKFSTPHRVAKWIKKQDLSICCLQKTHFRYKGSHRLKVKGWKKIFHANETKIKVG